MNRRRFLANSLAMASFTALPESLWAQEGSAKRQIIIGQSVDLSGPMQNIGRDYFTGAKLVFDQTNAGDGVQGRKIRFVQLDDGGDPAKAASNVKKLIEEENADVLFGMTSESCVEAAVNSAAFKSSDIELFAPVTGIDHPGAQGRVVYLRPSSAEEMVAILDRFTKMSLSRLALVHTASASMIAVRDAAMAGIRTRYADAPKAYALKDGGSNAAAVVSAIERDKIQAVVLITDAFSAAALIRPLRVRLPALFMCLGSAVDVQTVQQILPPHTADGIMVSRVVPDPVSGVIPVVNNFRRTLSKYLDEKPSSAGLEGYIAAQALITVLRKAENPRHFVNVAQRRVGSLDIGGWRVNLANNRAVDRVEMAMITADGRLL